MPHFFSILLNLKKNNEFWGSQTVDRAHACGIVQSQNGPELVVVGGDFVNSEIFNFGANSWDQAQSKTKCEIT